MTLDLGYLFAAAAVVWIGTMIVVIAFLSRQGRLQSEIDDLKRTVEEFADKY